ncbi:MAG: rRNA maturation RNase YbeY [Campylobacterota bacterium]|nr:rRNA maturation RNase YbeY [Campylobacterota bacterium]
MIDSENETLSQYTLDMLQTITDSLTDLDVELILTCNDEITKINAKFRQIDAPTDVLSFPNEPMPMAPLGSIIISDDYIKNVASELGHSEQDEFTLLYIHGLLHLLGYDHEVDSGEMRKKEEMLIKKYTLPPSLIVRTQKEV